MHRVFDTMRSIVERPGYRFLKSYKQDFYEYDRETLQTHWTDQAQYLWVVHENGTYLCPISLDKRATESALASLGQYRDVDIHHIKGDCVRSVTLQQAKDLARKVIYEWHPVMPNEVLSHGHRFATVTCEIQHKPNAIASHVRIGTRSDLTVQECADLQWLAMSRTIARSGTLFVSITSLEINGVQTVAMNPAAMLSQIRNQAKTDTMGVANSYHRRPLDLVC